MSERIQRNYCARARYARLHRAQPGQTLVVALAVLFILLFIGGAFVVRVARNLNDSARGRDTEDARALAEAGVKYCDNELNGSPEGADWRPVPTAPLGTGANDPDFFWLERGFTRLDLKGGRALVRVSYDPDPSNPVGQAIKIESIGRTGELDPNDPTVFVQNQTSPRLRRELVAYKRIGITDYLRFMTDKDKGSHTNFLGVPAVGHFFPQVFGNPMLAMNPTTSGLSADGSETLYGGPIFCNGNLTIMGDAYFYEGSRGMTDALGNPDTNIQQENISTAGVLTCNQLTASSPTWTRKNPTTGLPDYQAFINTMIDGTGTLKPITPTYDATGAPNINFDTYNSIVRDGSADPDRTGYSRGISRLTAPDIESFVNGTGSVRYRQLTRESGRWLNQNFNTGMHGWGAGIYLDNNGDLQQETLLPGVNGAYSLPADWTNPNAGFAQSAWQGPYYRPPGMLLELLGDRIRVTRSDGKSFFLSDGTPNAQNNQATLEIPLSDEERGPLNVPLFPHDGDDAGVLGRNSSKFSIDSKSYGVNVIVFAEGNIRVKGVYGTLTDTTQPGNKLSRVHLTIVTGGSAYIEGNLIPGDGTVSGAGSTPILQRNSTCQILAKEYVCVNTSMFMSPQNQTNVWSRITPDLDAFATEIGLPRNTYDTIFSNGVDQASYTSGGNPVAQMLMLRHAASAPGPTAINMLVNPVRDDGSGNTEFVWPSINPNPPSKSYPLGIRNTFAPTATGTAQIATPDPSAVAPYFEQKTFDIIGATAPSYTTYPGYDDLLRFQVDQTSQTLQNLISLGPLQSYLLSAVMVAPLDIRIEAGLYAQEKSFFIIPGYDFNPDANDTRSHFTLTSSAPAAGDGIRSSFSVLDSPADLAAKSKFPYHNEPLDVRITICGAIAENYTASVDAQAAWLKQWGYTAAKYGSFNAANPAQTEIPDDHLMARNPAPNAMYPAGYVAGDPGTLDFRTKLEKQMDAVPPANDFLLTRALRFEYDPKLAMPYFHSTDATLTGAGNRRKRQDRALRFINRTITNFGGLGQYVFRQVLPSMPRLPVSPDLIYSGASDVQLGQSATDTDRYSP